MNGPAVRLTRRQLAALAAVPAAAQTPETGASLAAEVREANRRGAEILRKFELPQLTEPAFQFKP